MKKLPPLCRGLLNPVAVAWSLALLAVCPVSQAAALTVEHRLEVVLIPGEQRLTGRDLMRIHTGSGRELSFLISETAKIKGVSVNGVSKPFYRSGADVTVPIEGRDQHREIELEVLYEALFKDPVPIAPVNTDNPGYGVTGSITEKGAFLLPGAGWYPELINGRATYRLRVQAPEGMLAVTAGRSLGHQTAGGSTFSDWLIEHPVQGLALSAAAYAIHERHAGDVAIILYFFPESRDLAPSYLNAVAEYLQFYSDLFGPYPFPKFAVVENFFPTGYGFPSYTLLGSTVLRLPFIVETSLGHEIAHSWWGSGVWVDHSSGNWVEGLTTYVSDYLYKEARSADEARDYRAQAIRNYSTLVPPEMDFPLSEFYSRTDPVTKAVGYDKGAMVFHMLRRSIGEEAFWSGLRELYRDRIFRNTSWKDIRHVFEARSNRSLEHFFDQWVHRQGAPRVRLDSVHASPAEERWEVRARIVQESPAFELSVGAALECGTSRTAKEVPISGLSTSFDLECSTVPERLAVDPDFHLLRRLAAAEIPPAVNMLKSSSSVLLLLAGGGSDSLIAAARVMAVALGLQDYRIVSERGLEPRSLEGRDVILMGLPVDRGKVPQTVPGLALAPNRFALDGRSYEDPSDVFFGVFRHPPGGKNVTAVFHPLSHQDAELVARKITHYGRYSYLTFRDGVNREKGFWPVEDSPVIFEWKKREFKGPKVLGFE